MRGRQLLYLQAIFILLLCLLAAPPAQAEHSRTVTAEEWQRLTADEDFSYRTKKELVQIQQPKKTNNFFVKLLERIFSFFSTSAGKTIVWILLLSIIGYAIYRILINEKTSIFGKKAKKIEEEDEVTTGTPEDILSGNWEHLLYEAMKKQDMKLAIRYSYMLMLQMLQNNHLIQYRPDKTNYDYYYELHSPEVRQNFKTLSRQYEFAWYGNYPVAQEQFDKYMNSFNQVKDMLRRR